MSDIRRRVWRAFSAHCVALSVGSAFVVILLIVLALVALEARAEDATKPPCSYTAALDFEDVPRLRFGDPNAAAKESAGINPLMVKHIDIQATETMVTLHVVTHNSFQDYWAYAQRRNAAGVPQTSSLAPSGEPLRGQILRFVALPEGKPEKAVDVRVWLDYASSTDYTPKYHVATAAENAADLPIGPNGLNQPGPDADIAGKLDVTIGLNDAEIRMPTKSFGWDADDEILFHFRRADTTVCIPEQD